MNPCLPSEDPTQTPKSERAAAGTGVAGAVVLDVDGVVLSGQFFLALSRHRGLLCFFKTLRDALSFNAGHMTIHELLSKVYGRYRGLRTDLLAATLRHMNKTPNVGATIKRFKENGYTVLLLSSGIPDNLVKALAGELGADEGRGIDVHELNGRLTGRVSNQLTQTGGKLAFLNSWTKTRDIAMTDVTVVGDDINNLEIMAVAGRSIGFHATRKVRKHVGFLVEADDFSKVADLVLSGDSAPPDKPVFQVELRRRLIHMAAFAIPFLFEREPLLTLLGLVLAAVFFSFSEFLRLNGFRFPGIAGLTRLAIRSAEKRRFAVAPLALALGVLVCLFFEPPIPVLAIGIIAFGDSVAGLVGQFAGRLRLPYNRKKTWEGTLAGFGVCLILCHAFLAWPQAIGVAAVAVLIESLPLGPWDNLVVPVIVALLCAGLC